MRSPDQNEQDAVQSSREQRAKLRGLTAALIVALIFAIPLTLGAVIYLLVSTQNQAASNGMLLESIADVNSRLIDCTTPDGECYEQNQEQTGKAIVGINEGTLKVIVAALTCQEQGISGEKALARCTARLASD